MPSRYLGLIIHGMEAERVAAQEIIQLMKTFAYSTDSNVVQMALKETETRQRQIVVLDEELRRAKKRYAQEEIYDG